MPQPLPRRTPQDRRLAEQPSERIPWDAFAVNADVSAPYGQPSPALMARAMRGWKKLGAMHTRISPSRPGEDGPA